MQGETSYETSKMSYHMKTDKDHLMVSLEGEEMYQLTSKTNGTMSLVAFESKVAANRFFSENAGYFFSKIN